MTVRAPYLSRGGPERKPPYRQTDYDPPNITGALLPPFAQTDWPLPIRAKLDLRYAFDPPNLALENAPAPLNPFAQTDWPLPQRQPPYRQAFELPSFVLGPVFIPPVLPAGRLLDWPNPILRKLDQRSAFDPPYLIGNAPVVGNPFYQSDWPLPIRAKLDLRYAFDPPRGARPGLASQIIQSLSGVTQLATGGPLAGAGNTTFASWWIVGP